MKVLSKYLKAIVQYPQPSVSIERKVQAISSSCYLSLPLALKLLVFLPILLILRPTSVKAVIGTNTFSSRYSADLRGDVVLIGNTLTTCTVNTTCTNILNGTTSGHNQTAGTPLRVDADGSSATTTNSSMAALRLPANSTVVKAYLYYQSGIQGSITSPTQDTQVSFGRTTAGVLPTNADYQPVNATAIENFTTTGSAGYTAIVDVTNLVNTLGNGDYWVGNLNGSTAAGSWTGWSLVVVFSNPAQNIRNISVNDGNVVVGTLSSNPSQNVIVSGFKTPNTGAFDATIGIVGYDGDRGLVDNGYRVNNTNVIDGQNTATESFNGSITDMGVFYPPTWGKNPNHVNNLSIDIDLLSVPTPGVIANGAATATFTVSSNNEALYLQALTTSIEIAAISGTLYRDNDNNGTFNTGDVTLPAGITVRLINPTDNSTVATTTTAADGTYTFARVNNGTYRIQVDTTDPDIPATFGLVTANNLNTTLASAPINSQNFGFSPPADLSLTKTVNNPSPTVGSNVTFTLTLTNAGPNSATGVTVADLLPGGLTFVSATPSAGTTYDSGTGVWTVGTVGTAVNANTATLQIVATVATVGAKTNTAQVSAATQGDPDSTPNNSVATEDDQASVTVNPITVFNISGTVFEDVNYGGGAGRDYTAANTAAAGSGFVSGVIRRPNVRVELYNSAGNYVTATTTDSSGAYTFSNQPANTTYTVRVVNSTITSARPSNGGTLIPVQTYRTNASTGSPVAVSDRVGGENPTLIDAGNGSTGTILNTTTGVFTAGITGQAQSITQVVAATSNITGIDFGFNFDTIVSNRDSGQGSLRQFIINSNALNNTSLAQSGILSGREESIFMLSDGLVHPGLRAGLPNQFSGGVATITLITALPAITGANGSRTSIDGRSQTALTGDSNPPIFNTTTGPEILINVAAGAGLQANAGSTFIRNIGITGANGVGIAGVGVYFNGAIASGSRLETATVFSNDNSGVALGNGATNINVIDNIIRNNGITDPLADGIELNNASNNFLQENLILNNPGYGIDLHTTPNNNNRIEGNQILNNGNPDDAQDAGIGLRLGSNNNIGQNTIANNFGDGIVIVSGTGNTLTENSIYDNGGLGIDLGGNTEGDGVTTNDNTDNDSGANDLLNFPIIERATLGTTNLIVTGFARPGSRIEFFVKAPDPSGFGEGQTYLVTYIEGSVDDTDSATGTYINPVNGVNQGTDTTNRFRFAISLNALSNTITNVDKITATATCFTADGCTSAANGSTSEFSGSLTLGSSPQVSLVKRITAINGVPLTGFDGVASDPNGNGNTSEDINWPTPLNIYLAGRIDGGAVKPNDEVEYTIYFLNNQSPATNFTICDPIPSFQTFIANGYNAASPHPTEPGALPTDTGIAIAWDANNLPTNPTFYLTNANDDDRGRYYLPNFAETPTTCQSNTNGTVVVNIVNSTTNLPNATAPGNPTNSYGFIRFKVKVN